MRKPWILVGGITILGIISRLFILSQRGSFWFDEAFSTRFAAMDISQMLHYLRFENNPPLYFILLHFWMKLFGSAEVAVRMLSMFFGIVAIPLTYVIGRRLHSETAGIFAAFLLALSPFQVFYSTETRMYSMYLFLALITVWIFIRNYELGIKNQARKSVIPYALFIILVLLVWTHITAWFIVLAMALYLFWQAQFSPKKFIIHNSSFIIPGVLAILSWLPWLINFVQVKGGTSLTQGYFFYYPADKNYVLDLLETFLVFGEKNAFVVTIVSVMMAVLIGYALNIRRSNLRRDGDWISPDIKFLLCWLLVPLTVGLAFNNAIPRYFIAVAPALYLLLGVGYVEIQKRISRAWIVPLLFFALIVTNYPSLSRVANHQWDNVAQWVQDQNSRTAGQQDSKAMVLINPHSEVLSFARYYKGAFPVVGFYPKEDTDDRDLRIVKTNWVSLATKENIPRLRDVTAGFQRVFLITGGIDTDTVGQNLLLGWFWDNDWKRQETKEFGKIRVTVLAR